ncbi:hypothetical protein D1970_00355 [Mesobacillus zeae]|uniref:TRASH domain-containing protein n=1 Tax=Mesobacillus zeae TaxID=1917180 RepID=A0A398BGY7_9BACI|nr:hypothetical protein D1970_00355 [Mesobacillus zeae]
MPPMIDICANCDAPINADKRVLYDDHAELHFCDGQCFREWAEDKGAEKVQAFYRRMNVREVIY